jgi:hypothetical protein
MLFYVCPICGVEFERKFPAKSKSPSCSMQCGVAARMQRPLADRFWKFVDKAGPIPEHRATLGQCWVWSGYRKQGKNQGYGELAIGPKGRQEKLRAHRISWELHNGEIPSGLIVLHRCDNPPCVNPEHLELGTKFDNVRDMDVKGRRRIRLPNVTSDKPVFTGEDILNIRNACSTGTSVLELAYIFESTRSHIDAIVTGASWKHVGGPIVAKPITRRQQRKEYLAEHKPPKRGRYSKLKPDEVVRIRQLAASGRTSASLSAEFGVCRQYIGQLVKRQFWQPVS